MVARLENMVLMAFDRPQVFPPPVSNSSRVYLVGLGQVAQLACLLPLRLPLLLLSLVCSQDHLAGFTGRSKGTTVAPCRAGGDSEPA